MLVAGSMLHINTNTKIEHDLNIRSILFAKNAVLAPTSLENLRVIVDILLLQPVQDTGEGHWEQRRIVLYSLAT